MPQKSPSLWPVSPGADCHRRHSANTTPDCSPQSYAPPCTGFGGEAIAFQCCFTQPMKGFSGIVAFPAALVRRFDVATPGCFPQPPFPSLSVVASCGGIAMRSAVSVLATMRGLISALFRCPILTSEHSHPRIGLLTRSRGTVVASGRRTSLRLCRGALVQPCEAPTIKSQR